MQPIPFFSLEQQTKALRKDLDRVWQRVTRGSGFVLGREVSDFEKSFQKFVGSKYAVATSSGLDALALALRALDLKPKDEVIVPANTFIATALAVTEAGAKVVLADVDPDTLLLDEKNILKVATRRTRVVVPVHLFGQAVRMDGLKRLCQKKHWFLIEDAAQAHGAKCLHKSCGNWGELAAFSFYPAKNLGAFGDAGIVTTSNRALYQKILALRNYGSIVKFLHTVKGYNRRMDALQAGILQVKLKRLTRWNRQRIHLARIYDQQLKSIPGLQILPQRKGCTNVYHLYIVRTQARNELNTFLQAHGVGTGMHYPIPIHLQKAYAQLNRHIGHFPVTENAAKTMLSLPMYPEMPITHAKRVATLIREFFKNPLRNHKR